jgi:hypothetical protein
MRAKPIFVLGLQRSGTTWIGNLLAAHPEVAALTDARHHGIHESLFFSHFARAWNWRDPAQRARAINAFLASDYGRLLALSPAEAMAVRQAETAAAAFALAMDLVAAREGRAVWVEKSPHHTRCAEQIARALPGAVFVAIHRDTVSLLHSRLGAYGRRPPRGAARAWAILRAAASNVWHRRLVDRLARRHPGRVVRLDFEGFRAGGDTARGQLLAALGLGPAPGLTPAFAPNSSFRSEADRGRALSRADRVLARVAGALVACLPDALLLAARALTGERRVTFPAWVWADPADRPDEIRIATPNPPARHALVHG